MKTWIWTTDVKNKTVLIMDDFRGTKRYTSRLVKQLLLFCVRLGPGDVTPASPNIRVVDHVETGPTLVVWCIITQVMTSRPVIIIERVFRRARSYSTLQHSLVLAACAPDSGVPAGGTRHRTKTEGASFVRSRSLAAVARWRLWRGAETSSPQLLPYLLPYTKTTTTALYFPEPISVLVRCKDDGLLYKTHLRPPPPPTNSSRFRSPSPFSTNFARE